MQLSSQKTHANVCGDNDWGGGALAQYCEWSLILAFPHYFTWEVVLPNSPGLGSYETCRSYATVLKTHQSYPHPRPCSKLGKPFSWFVGGDWGWGYTSQLLLNQFGTGSQLVRRLHLYAVGPWQCAIARQLPRPFHRPAFDHLQYCNQKQDTGWVWSYSSCISKSSR